jgi:hypothetical protein
MRLAYIRLSLRRTVSNFCAVIKDIVMIIASKITSRIYFLGLHHCIVCDNVMAQSHQQGNNGYGTCSLSFSVLQMSRHFVMFHRINRN